jgi:hypothetical protein
MLEACGELFCRLLRRFDFLLRIIPQLVVPGPTELHEVEKIFCFEFSEVQVLCQ